MNAYANHTDDQLLELLKSGDEQAYAALYKRYVAGLIDYAEAKLYSLEEAQDIIHDLFTKLWSDREKLPVQNHIKVYLFSAAKFLVIDRIRKNIVRSGYAEKLRSLSPAFCRLEEELQADELLEQVRCGLQSLPEKTQAIFRKSREEDKSIQEIALEMNLSRQTVKNQITVALKHLRSITARFMSLFF